MYGKFFSVEDKHFYKTVFKNLFSIISYFNFLEKGLKWNSNYLSIFISQYMCQILILKFIRKKNNHCLKHRETLEMLKIKNNIYILQIKLCHSSDLICHS